MSRRPFPPAFWYIAGALAVASILWPARDAAAQATGPALEARPVVVQQVAMRVHCPQDGRKSARQTAGGMACFYFYAPFALPTTDLVHRLPLRDVDARIQWGDYVIIDVEVWHQWNGAREGRFLRALPYASSR